MMTAPGEMNDDIRKFEEIGTRPAAHHNALAEALRSLDVGKLAEYLWDKHRFIVTPIRAGSSQAWKVTSVQRSTVRASTPERSFWRRGPSGAQRRSRRRS